MKQDQRRRRKLPKQDRLHCVGGMFYCSPDLQQAYANRTVHSGRAAHRAVKQGDSTEHRPTASSSAGLEASEQGYDRVIVDAECTHDGSIKVRGDCLDFELLTAPCLS